MPEDIRVAVSGAMGKMGQTVVRALREEPGMTLVAAVDPFHAGKPVVAGLDLKVRAKIEDALESAPDVLVDFTRPDVGGKNALKALGVSVRPVIGTTGLPEVEVAAIEEECQRRCLGAALISNFSLGLVALRRAAHQISALMPKAEILEMHHDQKIDAPSGTALDLSRALKADTGLVVPIHSVRLPGLLAHHEVIFGALGQTVSLRHDTLSRDAFVPGILVAIRRVMEVTGLKRDLDELL